MTFSEFCHRNGVTAQERKRLVFQLAMLRAFSTIEALSEGTES